MDRKKIQLIALVAIFAVLGVVLVYQFRNLAPPRGAAQKGKKAEAPRHYAENLQEAEMLAKRLPVYRKTAEQKEKQLNSYLGRIPLASDHTWLSRQINRIADEIGIGSVSQKFRQALSSDLDDPDMGKRYARRTWEIKMKCGYHELGQFLNNLEESNRFVEVLDIDIKGNEPRGQEIALLIRYLVRKQ